MYNAMDEAMDVAMNVCRCWCSENENVRCVKKFVGAITWALVKELAARLRKRRRLD